jgi:hypothetical protein
LVLTWVLQKWRLALVLLGLILIEEGLLFLVLVLRLGGKRIFMILVSLTQAITKRVCRPLVFETSKFAYPEGVKY